MHEDGRLDLARFKQLIDWHVAEGTDGIVVVGTTGESPTVELRRAQGADPHRRAAFARPHPDHRRHRRQLDRRGDRAHRVGEGERRHRVPFGGPVLQQADAGRPVPAFPQDRGDRRPADDPVQRARPHGGRPADRHVLRLAQVPGIIGIKEATANIERNTDLIRRAPRNFAIYSGDDAHRARADPARRPRRDLGHRQRRAQGDAPDVRRGAGRRREEGARAQPAAVPAAPEACSSRRTRSRSSGRSPRWA